MKVVTLLLILLFSSCTTYVYDKQIQNTSDLTDMSVVIIDSCEYIQYRAYRVYEVTHKGNCKYCTERAKR